MQIKIRVSIVEQLFFWIFVLPFLVFAMLFIHKPTTAESAEMTGVYFFANTRLQNISSGWNFVLAFEPTQPFPASSTLTISFQDDEDGYWCRNAGTLSVIGKSGSAADLTGTDWSIDAPLAGAITGNCTKGSGLGSSDTITINNVGPLSAGVTYGLEVYGNVGVLGTARYVYGHKVDIEITDPTGLITDYDWFLVSLTNNNSVTITAYVAYVPQCDDNFDCNYPLEICNSNQQCVPCTSNSQCSFTDLCVYGQCSEDPACNTNADCAFPNEICPASHICAPCTTNAQCGTGYLCTAGVCTIIPPPECTTNAECNYPNRICNSSQKCVACTSSAQCNSGDECISGVCVTPIPLECTTNAQCDYPQEICDQANMCNPCVTDWQCNVGQVCVAGVCTTKFKCKTNNDCKYPYQICNLNNDCGPCEYDSQCGVGSLCVDGVCEAIPPAECANNEQCNYPDLVCIDQFCTDCVVNSDCSGEDICIQGNCEAPSPLECTNNAHCDYPNEICDFTNKCNPCIDDDECNYGYECKSGVCIYEEPEEQLPVSNGGEWVSETFDTLLEGVGLNPIQVEETVREIENLAPVATTASVVTTTFVGLSLLNISFLEGPVIIMRGFLGLLTLLGIRTKGQPYGYVYNAITKDPISNALVRIFKHENDQKKLIRTSVTNSFGVFDSELDPGQHSLFVSKSGFGFPSEIVGTLTDYPLENIYKGNVFKTDKEVQVYFSIPVDPKEKNFFDVLGAVMRERLSFLAKFVQLSLLIFGAAFSLILFLTIPVVTNLLIFLIYIPSITFTVMAFRYKEAKYGDVVDELGKPVKGVTLGLYNKDEERYVTKRVSDEEGHFRFVADRANYELQVLDTFYQAIKVEKEEIDSRQGRDMIVVIGKVVVRKKELAADDPSLASNILKQRESAESEAKDTGSQEASGGSESADAELNQPHTTQDSTTSELNQTEVLEQSTIDQTKNVEISSQHESTLPLQSTSIPQSTPMTATIQSPDVKTSSEQAKEPEKKQFGRV